MAPAVTQPTRQPFYRNRPKPKHSAKIKGKLKKLQFSAEQKEMYRRLFVWIVSILLALSILSAFNDVAAINRNTDLKTVTISEQATTTQVLKSLKTAGLIHHPNFCEWFLNTTGEAPKNSTKYLPGTYELSADQGVEGMIHTLQEGLTPDSAA